MKFEKMVMNALARFVIRFHRIIPFFTAACVVLSILAARNIRVTTQIKDMMPEDNPQVESLNQINDEFQGGATLIITIEGESKDEMAACAEAFAREIRNNPEVMQYVNTINLKMERDFLTTWGFILQNEKDLKKSRELFSHLNLLPFLTSLNDSFEETYTGEKSEEELVTHSQESGAVALLSKLETFFLLLRQYLQNPESEPLDAQAKKFAETFMYGDSYRYSIDNRMLMFSITPNFPVNDIDSMVAMMKGVKEIRRSMENKFPRLGIGYTGEIAMGADEQEAMGFDMLVPSLIALGAILILFLFSFTPFKTIVFTLITLVVGVLLTYGFVGITFKEITIVTSFMAVLLIGLGIDFGIQVVTNFITFREDGMSQEASLYATFTRAGMGNLLAALTTAAAFFVMAGTGSKAYSQFGIIAGAGILLCFLVMVTLLPSLLLWLGKKDPSRFQIPTIRYRFVAHLGKYMHQKRWHAIILGLMLTAGLGSTAFLNRFEYDFMKLEPQHMEAFRTYDRLAEKFDISPLPSMVIAENIDEARHLTDALEKLYPVAEVNSIAHFLPSEVEQESRLEIIRRIREMRNRYEPGIKYSREDMEAFTDELQRLEWNVIEMGDLSVAALGEENRIVKKRNDMIREIFGANKGAAGQEVFQRLITLVETDPALYAKRLSSLDSSFTKEMDRIISEMAQVDRKITSSDLPKELVGTLLSLDDERNLIIIYPLLSVVDDDVGKRRFNRVLEEVSSGITGWTRLAFSWTDEVFSESRKAALYIFAVVLLVMVLTFRSVLKTIIAAVPLVLGTVWMLGAYPLFGMKLNSVNVAVIPLIIGMGIDFGIHLVHRFSIEQDIEEVYRYTGKAVFLSALTTMIGFGSLSLIGSFPSIVSIGAVLFLGIGACLFASLTILPALLTFGKPEVSRKLEDLKKTNVSMKPVASKKLREKKG